MNFTLIKIGPSDDEEYSESQRLCGPNPSSYVKTDSFTVLPPLSPQIPGPPATPNPYRILPPIVSRKRPSFVILQELGNKSPSRDPSPSGRVSPFRGCGFRPSSKEHSRERSPASEEETKVEEKRRSRSRLPIARQPTRKVSKSASPLGNKNSSGIPRPFNRRISYSPNRSRQVLTEMDMKMNNKQIKPPLKSSENLTSKNSFKRKPPLPQKTKPKDLVPRKMIEKKTIALISPGKTKSFELETEIAVATREKRSPAKTRITQMTNKNSNAMKFKENVAPTKIPSPVRTDVHKFLVKSKKTEQVISKVNKEHMKSASSENLDRSNKITKTDEMKSIALKSAKKKTISVNLLSNANKKIGKEPLSVGKTKSRTDFKLLEQNSEQRENEKKKDLPHTDTSKSLPISVGSSNMSESSATLIRTTTEPALAPVEPDLITEIRSAMNEVKKEEEICLKEEKKNLASTFAFDSDATVDTVVAKITEIDATENENEVKEINEQIEPSGHFRAKQSDLKKLISRNSSLKKFLIGNEIDSTNYTKSTNKDISESKIVPQTVELMKTEDPAQQPVHVIAVTIMEEQTPQLTEITAVVGSIKHKPDDEVQSADAITNNANRNGMSKSSWLNDKPSLGNMKNSIMEKCSEENLVEHVDVKTPSRWKKFANCSKCVEKSDKRKPSQITTISRDSEPLKIPKTSRFGEYFSCLCHKCNLKKKNENASKTQPPNSTPKYRILSCFSCEKKLKRVIDKISCKKNKRNVHLTKTAESHSETPRVDVATKKFEKQSCCVDYKSRIIKYLSVMCCVNTVFCLKSKSCCAKICCCKCVSSKERKKIEMPEKERRKSTISTPKKKKWTKMFTDFPKLDANFVEHASVMRGAVPVLPVPLAWICLILNVFLPGFGTLSSGLFCLFVGKPRFSVNDSIVSRIGAFLVNFLVASSQLFTVLFCLVGWGWSIWWGVMMLKMAKKNKRILEQSVNTFHIAPVVNQNHDIERGNS